MCARWLIQAALEVVAAGDSKADLPSARPSVWWKCRISVCGTATIVLWHCLFRYNALRQLGLMRSFSSDHVSICLCHPKWACPKRRWGPTGLQGRQNPQNRPLQQVVSLFCITKKPNQVCITKEHNQVCITKETRYLFPSFISAGALLSLPASLRFSSAKRCQKFFFFELSVILVLTISTEILKLLVVPAPGFLFTTCRGQIRVLKFRLTALKMPVL